MKRPSVLPVLPVHLAMLHLAMPLHHRYMTVLPIPLKTSRRLRYLLPSRKQELAQSGSLYPWFQHLLRRIKRNMKFIHFIVRPVIEVLINSAPLRVSQGAAYGTNCETMLIESGRGWDTVNTTNIPLIQKPLAKPRPNPGAIIIRKDTVYTKSLTSIRPERTKDTPLTYLV